MSLRVAVIVGVVVALLFVAVLAFGGGDGQGSASEETEQEGGLLGRLRARVGDPSLVDLDDVTSTCPLSATGLLQFNGCALTVMNSGSGIRTLRLSPVAGTFRVSAPAPEGDSTITDDEVTVDPASPDRDDVVVAVGEGETVVQLACSGIATTCQAQVVEG
jgi:hypothetical protein